jgi:hypothetical protein
MVLTTTYFIHNYLYSERCSVAVYEMVNFMKKVFSSKNSSFPLRGKSTANLLIYAHFIKLFWNAQWCSCLRHCVTSLNASASILDGIIGIFLWLNPSCHTMPLRSTLSLTYMSTRYISWVVKVPGA